MLARIEKSEIDALVKNVRYTVLEGTTITICYIELQSTFIVIGQSAPMNKVDYNKEDGEKYAYDDAYSKIWEFEGYHRKAQAHVL